MREVIQKVVATENEAKRLVQTARSQADQLVAQAQAQARELLARAQRDARQEAETILAAAETEAAAEKARQLEHARAGIEDAIRLDPATAQQAVEAAYQCLCAPAAAGQSTSIRPP